MTFWSRIQHVFFFCSSNFSTIPLVNPLETIWKVLTALFKHKTRQWTLLEYGEKSLREGDSIQVEKRKSYHGNHAKKGKVQPTLFTFQVKGDLRHKNTKNFWSCENQGKFKSNDKSLTNLVTVTKFSRQWVVRSNHMVNMVSS